MLQVCESYPPKYGGGAGIVAKDISLALVARGHDVHVLTTESRPGHNDYSLFHERDHGVDIDRVTLRYLVEQDPDGWQLGIRAWKHHERRIAKLLEERLTTWRPDAVQYHTTRPFGEVGPLVIARHRIPIIAVLHEAWFICPRLVLYRSPTAEPCEGPGAVKCLECMYSNYDGGHARAVPKLAWRIPRLRAYPAYRLWRRRAARRSLTGALAFSKFMAGIQQPHIPGPISFLPIGINLEGLPEVQPRRPRVPLRFGFFGGFQPIKGIWHVLDAAAALQRENLDFELYVWGPGASEHGHEIQSRRLGDRVRTMGTYEPDTMWEAYGQIDVALMATTVHEALGRIPLEARAAGAPSIVPAVGGLRESVRDEVDGLLYRFCDPKDLERQMRRILTEAGLFEQLSSELKPVVDTRTRGEVLEQLYRSIIDRNGIVAA